MEQVKPGLQGNFCGMVYMSHFGISAPFKVQHQTCENLLECNPSYMPIRIELYELASLIELRNMLITNVKGLGTPLVFCL